MQFLLPPNEKPSYIRDNMFTKYLTEKRIPSIHDPFVISFLPPYLRKKALDNLHRDTAVIKKAMKHGKTINNQPRAVKPSLDIGYVNLHKPLKQIPFMMNQSRFGKLDVVVLNELMLDPIYFENFSLVPTGYDVYYHKPVWIKSNKVWKRRIFSAILIKKCKGFLVKQMPAPAPFTTVFCKVKQLDGTITKLNILSCYRTHFDAHSNNLGLKIYSSQDSPEIKRQKHNLFYQENFLKLVRKYQSKCAGVVVGDFNMDIYHPRPQDNPTTSIH